MRGPSAGFAGNGYPVLDGLEKAGIAGKYIAEVVHVSASTVSKWRTGSSIIPPATMVFLTLVLASVIEDMEVLERRLEDEGCAWNDLLGDQLLDLHRALREQEIYNAAIAPEAVREGAGLFRNWLEKNDGVAGTVAMRNVQPAPADAAPTGPITASAAE